MALSTQTRYTYQYGSEAENYYQPLPRPHVEPEYRPAVEPQKKIDVVFGLKLSLCGMTVFVCAFVYIHMYSTLITRQGQLQTVKNEIRALRSTISLTESQISEKLNLDYIKYRASRELGMSEPLPHQIVYIQLPKQSHTIYDK
ncbi:hypothetical protein [Cellulosilyticum sp. I15G10I2]|uniref:hypothetical protein n=1 Tax=Cellulosilyticum sp. I15G10I2 TaxID=1892843 RepID=UPI00085CC779|nr:hypothetical protein [Cellulosilyticum sp. I15G10I2]